jgi:hypothetical protein
MALKLGVDEIVMPDVITDYETTIREADDFLGYIRQLVDTHPLIATLNLGYVIQITDPKTLQAAIDPFLNEPLISVLHLPRSMNHTMGAGSRIKVAQQIHDTYGDRFEIHLLGASASFVKELEVAQREAPWIRSMDTSMPFNYALVGALITDECVINRAPGYFDMKFTQEQHRLAGYNIGVMKSWTIK